MRQEGWGDSGTTPIAEELLALEKTRLSPSQRGPLACSPCISGHPTATHMWAALIALSGGGGHLKPERRDPGGRSGRGREGEWGRADMVKVSGRHL